MEITYESVCQTAVEQGVCLLRISVQYPVCTGEETGIAHINEFEKRYAKALADGMLAAQLPTRKQALADFLANGGRRSLFPTKRIELTGEITDGVEGVVWKFVCVSRCGGECERYQGARFWRKDGVLCATGPEKEKACFLCRRYKKDGKNCE